MDTEDFKRKAKKRHGNKYDYSHVSSSVTHKDKVTIVCPIHGEFVQNVNSHLLRSGCPMCGKLVNIRKRMKSRAYYIGRSTTIHNDKYDYSLIPPHPKATDKVVIICPIHGEFSQRLCDHLRGHGCNRCARDLTGHKISKGFSHFLSRCSHVHGNRYVYDQISQDVRIKDVVIITCKEHGDFSQVLDCHLSGSGCPTCSRDNHVSRPELEIQKMLRDLDIKFTTNDRTIIPPKELDIWIESRSLAIEYCGLYWHSETCGKTKNYHKSKMDACNRKGIRLITIFEDEWIHRKPQVTKKILSILGLSNDRHVYARKCSIVTVDGATKRQFFAQNHIQGDGLSSINIGLEFDKELVAVSGFTKHQGKYYLTRYATSTCVVGGFSRLMKHFTRHYQWDQIVSFADLRWSVGALYETTGWALDSLLPPDYSYVEGNVRRHKFNYRRRALPKILKTFDPKLSEKQNCDNNGILRIWDCGKQRWTLTNNERVL